MPWPFDRRYMELALVAGVVVGACAPLIGTFLVQKRMSLIGDGIGHLAFAGVAGGLLLGIWPVWSALAVSVVGALTLERLRSRGRTSGDLALALFFYGGIAAGVVMVGLSGSFNAGLFTYLFGSILTVGGSDVAVIVGLGVLIVATIGLTRRALFAVVADEEWARVAGIPVGALNSVLAALTAVTIVASMRVVGVLLVAALMVLPVAAGQLLARSFRGTLGWSVTIGIASVVVGLVAARAWGLAPSGTIVLVAVFTFGVVSLLTGRREGWDRLTQGLQGRGDDRSPGPVTPGAHTGH
jgi:zinc transport system permease protein